jgi:membrane-associated phospholipid phosphatase
MRTPTAAIAVMLAMVETPAGAQAVRELRHDTNVDATVLVSGGVLWLGSEILKTQLAPSECRWCTSNAVDDSVRSTLVWQNVDAADKVSDVFAYGLAPSFAIGLSALASYHDGGSAARWATDALLIGEASVLAMDLNHVVKLAAGRERPFVHALPADRKPLTAHPSDNNVSFFSSHTTWVFALAASSGTVATMRGYRLAPAVWAVGAPIALATGWLRIAADRHYFTDVAVGAVVGSALGVGIPLAFHGREPATSGVTVGASASPLAIGCAGKF